MGYREMNIREAIYDKKPEWLFRRVWAGCCLIYYLLYKSMMESINRGMIRNIFRHSVLLLVLTSIIGTVAKAEVRLPSVFADHMVLQRGQEVPVWGWANPRERVQISFLGEEYRTKADENGKWKLVLPRMKAGGPYEMQIEGKNTITLKDIMIGEVWLCSGQSNMEWPMKRVRDSVYEINAANKPLIRLYRVKHKVSPTPEEDVEAESNWAKCSPETVADFSAVAYFFAKRILDEQNVAVGLIQSTWGGTVVETWTSKEAIAQTGEFPEKLEELGPGAFEEIFARKKARMDSLLASFGQTRGGLVEGDALWAKPDLDVSSWKLMEVPRAWENAGIPSFDGVVWFRKTFSLSAAAAKRDAVLELGPIDDSDKCWVNGEWVGETDGYDVDRRYVIPASVLQPGVNVIAVRILDTGGNGGIWGKPEKLRLVSGDGVEKLAGLWQYRISPQNLAVSTNKVGPNDYPTLLYNAMINGLIPYAIKGAIWYQGESNAGRAYQYRKLFPTMIRDWRSRWGYDFPFLFVQLANFHEVDDNPEESAWAELREAQLMTLDIFRTGMASAIDIGEADDIHPRNKQDVGERLAVSALSVAYREDVVYSGPIYKDHSVKGDNVYISFDHIGRGLLAKGDKYGYLKGFAIAGTDRKFRWAFAYIKDEKVVVWHPDIKSPVAVRYGWSDNPDDLNLYNVEGLPASPFRTDDWKGITYSGD